MTEDMIYAAEQVAKAKRLEALILRWSDEADRLLMTEDRAIPVSVRKLLNEIAGAML